METTIFDRPIVITDPEAVKRFYEIEAGPAYPLPEPGFTEEDIKRSEEALEIIVSLLKR